MDLDALRSQIASNRARNIPHGYARRVLRGLNWDAVRANIVQGCELVEDYPNHQPTPRVLLLSRMPDKRPLHTVWEWDGMVPPLLVTAYQPDEPAYRHLWTNGYRKRVRPPPP